MRRYCLVVSSFAVREGRVLLIKHKRLGLWLAPGGHVDEGETPEQAALRELREETGLEADFAAAPSGRATEDGVEPLRLPFHMQVEPIPGHNHHLNLVYALRARPGEVDPGPGESREWRWHSAADLAGAHVRAEVRETALKALSLVGESLISEGKSC